MQEHAKKPAIRFKGFTDDWEQRKADSVGYYTKGNGYSKADLTGDGMPIILYGRLYTNYSFYIDRVDTFVGEIKSCVYSEGGEVIVPASGETAEDIARASAVLLKGVLLGGDLNILNLNSEYDSKFIALLLSNGNTKKELSKCAQGKSVVHIHNSDIQKLLLMIPIREEQRKIAELFTSLDRLITLHQRKYDKLVNIKKAMLEKMFPKDGAKVPEIRFKGFNNDWEQRKLGEISDVRDDTHESPQYVKEGHPFITSRNVADGYINYNDIQYISTCDYNEINKRSKVDINDILMGMIGTIGNLALIREIPNFAIKNVALIKYIGKVYSYYLYHALQSRCVIRQLSNGLDGGTQKFIALNKVRELKIPVPDNKEQYKLGEYFDTIDRLITLHQRKLEKLQNLKQACLEKLFV